MARNTNPKPEDEQVVSQQPEDDEQVVSQQLEDDEQVVSQQLEDGQVIVREPVDLVVISAQGLNLRAEPHMGATALAALTAGTTLTRRTVTEAEPDGWLAVQTKTGKAGYVRMEYVAIVE